MDSIRIKRGMSTELPKSLPLGELAFCIDTRELWVGSGDGLALKRVTNTEITQHLDEWNALYTEVDERFETKYVDVSAQFSEKFNELCQQFATKSDALDTQFANKYSELSQQFQNKYNNLEREYAQQVHSAMTLSADNKQSIDLLKRDIGTTANIEDLQQVNNQATETLEQLNQVKTELESDVLVIKDIEKDTKKAHIDYEGNHHDSLKDSMDANIDFIKGEFNTTHMTGENITCENTILRHVKQAEMRGHTELNCIKEPSGKEVVLPYEFDETQKDFTLEDTKDTGSLNIVLKGNTEVNVLKNPMRDYVVPYEFEEGYTATLTDTKETGSIQSAILKGQTLMNHFPPFNPTCWEARNGSVMYDGYVILKANNAADFRPKSGYRNYPTLKPSTQYTYIYYVSENVGNVSIGAANGFPFSGGHTGLGVGLHKSLVITPEEIQGNYISQWFVINADDRENGYAKITMMMLIEGDWTNTELPFKEHFDGMQSVQMPVLTSTGKNLFRGLYSDFNQDGWGSFKYGNVGEYYTVSIYDKDTSVSLDGISFGISVKGDEYNTLNWITNGNTVYINSLTTNNRNSFTIQPNNEETLNKILQRFNIQIEEGSTATSYEPYKSNILSTSEDVELRGVGEVRDELNLLTGEVTERIGEIVLDGTQSNVGYRSEYSNDDYYCFMYDITKNGYKKAPSSPIGISCPIPFQQNIMFGWETAKEFVLIDKNNLVVKLLKSRLSNDNSISTLNTYLASHPITINYPLMDESIKTVDLSILDQDGLSVPALSTYNEVTHIDTTVPENYLKPLISSKTPEFPVMIKPNTKYSIVADTTTNGFDEIPLTYNLGGAEVETSVGEKLTVIQTPSTLENETFKVTGTGMKLSNVMILEKDLTGKELPNYTEGMQSVKMPVLTTTNCLNLFTKDNTVDDGGQDVFGDFVEAKKNDKFSFNEKYGNGSWTSLAIYNVNKERIYYKYEDSSLIPKTIVLPDDDRIAYVRPRVANNKIDTIMFNRGEVIPYEEYKVNKSNILTVNEDVTLRGIGDVRDELDLLTGEVVQSVGVLNGEETGWQREPHSQAPTDSSLIAFSIDLIKSPNKNLLSSVLVKSSNVNKPYRWYISFNSWLVITLPKSEVTNLDEFKAWLKNNEVLYPLTEKSIKTVDFTITNQNGAKVTKLSTFNDVTYISTTVAEGALNPIISHKDLEYEVLLKPNTKYSIITNPISNGHPNSPISFDLGGQQVETTVGSYCTLVTTPNSLTHNKLVMKGRGNKLRGGVMVIEGDKTGMMFNHFDGMKSVEEFTVKVANNNLFNKDYYDWSKYSGGTGQITGIHEYGGRKNCIFTNPTLFPQFTHVKPNKQYTVKFDTLKLDDNGHGFLGVEFNYTDGTTEQVSRVWGNEGVWKTSMATSNASKQIKSIKIHNASNGNDGAFIDLDSFVIVEGTSIPQVESRHNSLPLIIPLRSLPNGVCDTLDLITGEYVQRVYYQDDFANCNFTIFEPQDNTASSGVPVYKVLVNSEYPLRDLGYNQSRDFSILCDVLKVRGDENGYSVDRGSYISTRNGRIFFHLIKEEVGLPTDKLITRQIFMDWLNVFPIKFCAELLEPIVTKLDLAWEDGKLFAYDGTTHFFVDVDGGHLQPVLDIDVPTDIVAELSRLRAERTELETSKASLESQITLLDKHNKELVSQVKQLSETNTQLANETKSLRNQTRVNKNNLNNAKSSLLEGQKVLEFNQEELHQEQERTKIEQQVQDQQILSSMLASTEIFELVLALMPMQLGNERQSTEGGSKMVEVYVTLIIAGEKTLEQVPALVRPKVEAQLKAMGVLA